ncbi:unnamed protein product [Callosobruchus maculatus]|uniref:Amino acid transporter transmembrane domain-containing protein n=1 Tax=Callosobruchus maculatus TaxID=64391 RepID=A0A653BDX6_CALMS|nr:unnamed protein product [Callosobruchus maculatus]VEN33683.1 unnamed protein product [Callosobruchus maculatus]
MKDLIRNYKITIKNRTEEESDYDPIVSSSSSHDYGACNSDVFGQEFSTASEDESVKTTGTVSRYANQNTNGQVLTSFVNVYEKLKGVTSANLGERFDKIAELGRNKFDDAFLIGIENSGKASSWETLRNSPLCQQEEHTTHSIVTIFAIWNTTMGSSLLAMAWGIAKTGLFPAIIITVAISGLCLYTTHVLLCINRKHGIIGGNFEVPELCRLLLGRWAEIMARIFSMIVLIGADIVYWILMSNFLYNFVSFVYDIFHGNPSEEMSDAVICLKNNVLNINTTYVFKPSIESSGFYNIWDLYSTVPVILAVIMFPILNFKSPTFFTKFNSLGTVSVTYLLIFVAIKSFSWGPHIQNWSEEWTLKSTFPSLTGMLSMSYFIHNIIITIMRHNRHQENNSRDLTIAFSLITFTYVFIGIAFYIGFPLAKACIEDNLLNNFPKGDTLTLISRVLLLFQLFTVFPLITYMLRQDILTNLNSILKLNSPFGYGRVVCINFVVVLICIMFACFLPRIGTLIRYCCELLSDGFS